MESRERIIKYKKNSKAGKKIVKESLNENTKDVIKRLKKADGYVVFIKKDGDCTAHACITSPIDVMVYMDVMKQTIIKMMETIIKDRKGDLNEPDLSDIS